MNREKYADLSKEELIQLLEAREQRARFGLVWEANEIERDKALNSDFVALDLVPELSCGEAPWRNLIIEGDNFDALRHLKMSFAGKVKCIYIDPPYNTGNRDFVYNDRFVDREDSWRHSKWCEFMFQRLTLAKDLLRQDGVIFVSIDDNEVFALGLLMNKVFGASNFVATCIWHKRVSPANDAKYFSADHDYVLCFANSKDSWKPNRQEFTEQQTANYTNPDNDARGTWNSSAYTCAKTAEERPNLYYPIIQPQTGEEIWPSKMRVWAFGLETHQTHISEDRIYWGKDGKSRSPRLKKFLSTAKLLVPRTLWGFDEAGHNSEANLELRGIIGDTHFTSPKPVRLISKILRLSIGPEDLVVDFFAGSGTTAHAVLKLNAEDGGKRRFILVSNAEATTDAPDKNLCRDVCAQRVKRVIEGYGDTPGLGGDFAYLKTRRIPVGSLLEIEHSQVWTALQLAHWDTLTPYEDAPFLWAGDEEEAMCYVPRFRREDAPALRKALRQSTAVTLYSWQPLLVRQHVCAAHVTHLPIPETLAMRFGLHKGGNR